MERQTVLQANSSEAEVLPEIYRLERCDGLSELLMEKDDSMLPERPQQL